jgi:hypothetical protein
VGKIIKCSRKNKTKSVVWEQLGEGDELGRREDVGVEHDLYEVAVQQLAGLHQKALLR